MYRWQYAAYTLPRIQVRRHSTRVAAWETDLARWLYGIEARNPRPDALSLAQELASLCDRHQIRAMRLLTDEVALTQLCVVLPMWNLRYLAHHRPPDHLSDLVRPDPELMETELSWMNVVAFETLYDYVVASYGRDALPALIEGFQRYYTWDALIPSVFGISAEEFERGWQHYLQTLH